METLQEIELALDLMKQIRELCLVRQWALEHGVEIATPQDFRIEADILLLCFESGIEVAYCVPISKFRVTLRLGWCPDQILGFFDPQQVVDIAKAWEEATRIDVNYPCQIHYPENIQLDEYDREILERISQIKLLQQQ